MERNVSSSTHMKMLAYEAPHRTGTATAPQWAQKWPLVCQHFHVCTGRKLSFHLRELQQSISEMGS